MHKKIRISYQISHRVLYDCVWDLLKNEEYKDIDWKFISYSALKKFIKMSIFSDKPKEIKKYVIMFE